MAFATIRDVANLAGVSVSSVSQVLHGKGRFSEATKQAVRDAVDHLGYIPDSRAQAMRSTHSKTIGLLVPDIRNPYFADLVSSVDSLLYQNGYETMIGTFAEDAKRQDTLIDNLLRQRIDGAIIVPAGAASPGLMSIIRRGLPIVFIDRLVPDLRGQVPCVVSDPVPGIRQALSYIKRNGHTRVMYVAHPSLGSYSVDERERVFASLGVKMLGKDNALIDSIDSTPKDCRRAISHTLDSKATAMIFGYSPDAVRAIGILNDLGLMVGDGMSLVSFDDIDVFSELTPRVSTISQQIQDMGRQGVDLLMHYLESSTPSANTIVSIPTVFIPRDSVGDLAQ